MKTLLKLALLLLPMTLLAQAPQIPLTGNIGSGFNGPLINSPAVVFATDADHTMVYPEMSGSGGTIIVTSTPSLTATRNLIAPNTGIFNWVARNNTTGGQSITVKVAGGTGVSIANGNSSVVMCDTVNCYVPGGQNVTQFLAPTASWPSWLVPTVTNQYTTPSLAVTAAYTPLSAVTATAPVDCTTSGSSVNCSMAQATSSVDGYLSHVDWTAFNAKQAALTNPVTGTGTTGYYPLFTGASTIGNGHLDEVTTAGVITSTEPISVSSFELGAQPSPGANQGDIYFWSGYQASTIIEAYGPDNTTPGTIEMDLKSADRSHNTVVLVAHPTYTSMVNPVAIPVTGPLYGNGQSSAITLETTAQAQAALGTFSQYGLLTSPTTTSVGSLLPSSWTPGHTFVPVYQPSGSAIAPTVVDANTLSVSYAATAGSTTYALNVQCYASDTCPTDSIWQAPVTAPSDPLLTAQLNSGDTTMQIATLAGVPITGHMVTVPGEEIGYTFDHTSGGNSIYNITRGHHGTTPTTVILGTPNLNIVTSESANCTTCGVNWITSGGRTAFGQQLNPGLGPSVLGDYGIFRVASLTQYTGNGGEFYKVGPSGGAIVASGYGPSSFDASGAAAARQANLSLLPGTYTNGDMCTYASSGTLLNCNTAIPTVGTWGALNYPPWASGTPFVKMTAAGAFALDTNTYLTSLSGALLATGATTGATSQAQVFTDGVTLSNLSSYSGDLPSIGSAGLIQDSGIAASNVFQLPSLTSGSVLYSNGSTIAQDNANFFWDATNHRLGIGTTTPAYSLDVQTGAAGKIAIWDGSNGSYLGRYGIIAIGASLPYGFSGFSNYSFDNNVGIGTTSPHTTLQLNNGGDVGGAGGSLGFSANAGNLPMAQINGSLTGAAGAQDAGDLVFSTTPSTPSIGTLTERMRILSTGNVGIGTTSPGAKLTVAGTSHATTPQVFIGSNLALGSYDSNYAWIQSFASSPLYINAQGNNTIINPTSGNVSIGDTTATSMFNVGTANQFQVSSTGVSSAGAGSTDYSTASSAQVAHCLADGTGGGVCGLVTKPNINSVNVASALASSAGVNNFSAGYGTMGAVTSASATTGVGANVLAYLTTGPNNTSLGYSSCINIVAGIGNTCIGTNSGHNSGDLTNSISIGDGASALASNTAVIGSSITDVYFGDTIATATIHGEKFSTATNCASSSSPAVCGSSAAGSVVIPTGTTSSTLTVNTTAVTADSQIVFYPDDSLGTRLSTTCNSTLATLVGGSFISARTPGTSFTITFNGTIVTNGVCGSYTIIN